MANPATPSSVDSTIFFSRVAHSSELLFLEDLNQSTPVIFRCVENQYFPEDVKEVEQNKEGKKSCKLSNLRPVFVGGVVRAGGR